MATSAERKYDALIFWGNHGLSATQDAFKVSRSTLYVWRKRYRDGGLSALHDASTAPRKRRRRHWPSPLKDEIKRLRERHPNIGKEKLHVLLAPWCDEHGSPRPSVSTIGRLIADDPNGMRKSPCRLDRRGRRKRRRSAPRPRLPKGHRSAHAGQVVSLDTITRFRDGIRYHVFTATIAVSDRSFSITAPSPNTAAEGSSLTYTVSLAGVALTDTATITYSLSGTDIAAGDFATAAGGSTALASLTNTVEMSTGESSANLVLHLRSDGTMEAAENFMVTLTGASGGGGSHSNNIAGSPDNAAGGSIIATTTFSISGSPRTAEGGNLSFSVVGIGPAPGSDVTATCTVSGSEVTVGDFRVSATATDPATDFPTATLTFNGSNYTTPQNCVIYTYDDTGRESTENFTVTLTVGGGAVVGSMATATGTINANDDPILTADINGDTTLDGDDALIMYQVYALGGAGVNQQLMNNVNEWEGVGATAGGDLNSDGEIDGDDALILYYAATFRELLQAHARLRAILLGELVNDGIANPSDADYREMLRQAIQLLDAVNTP